MDAYFQQSPGYQHDQVACQSWNRNQCRGGDDESCMYYNTSPPTGGHYNYVAVDGAGDPGSCAYDCSSKAFDGMNADHLYGDHALGCLGGANETNYLYGESDLPTTSDAPCGAPVDPSPSVPQLHGAGRMPRCETQDSCNEHQGMHHGDHNPCHDRLRRPYDLPGQVAGMTEEQHQAMVEMSKGNGGYMPSIVGQLDDMLPGSELSVAGLSLRTWLLLGAVAVAAWFVSTRNGASVRNLLRRIPGLGNLDLDGTHLALLAVAAGVGLWYLQKKK